MGKMNKKKLSKIWPVIAIIGVMVLTIWLIYHFFGDFFATLFTILRNGDQAELTAYLNSQNEASGLLSIFLLTILQVVSIFFPGMVIHIVAGVIYGWWKAFLACYAGFVAGNVLVFIFARKFGSALQSAFNVEKRAGLITSKINSTKPAFIFALACMIPGIPNGFIPYFAARTDIRAGQYAMAVAVSSWIQILCNCFAGHFLIRGEYFYMVMAIILQIVIILIAIWKRDWFLGKGRRNPQKAS